MRMIAALGLATTLIACSAPASAQSLSPEFEAALNRSKADYSQLRATILESGWRPVANPACQRNVYGGSAEEPLGPVPPAPNVCQVLTEVESCSGDGYCNMYFSHPRQSGFLHVVTYGDYGALDTLNVEGWELSRTSGLEG